MIGMVGHKDRRVNLVIRRMANFFIEIVKNITCNIIKMEVFKFLKAFL